VDGAHRLGHKVAAHAGGREAIEQGVKTGVDSSEHGNAPGDVLALYIYGRGGRNANSELSQFRGANFRRAGKRAWRLFYGADIGGYAWMEMGHFALMVKWGMTPVHAILAKLEPAKRGYTSGRHKAG
jgi:imidazolonepropionase-like amidohydrolase